MIFTLRKTSYFISLLLLLPSLASAEVNHIRSFSESPILSSRIVVTIVVDDYNTDINCGGLAFWGVQAIEHKTGNRFSGNPRFVSSAVLSQTFTIDVLPGDYEEMTFICSDDGDNEAFQFGSIENDFAVSTKQNPPDDSAKSSPETEIIPSLIKGISDFWGVSPEMTSTETLSTDMASSTITIVDVVTATTSPEEATTTPEAIAPSEEAITTQAVQGEDILLVAAIGALNLQVDMLLITVLIVDTLLLVFLYRYIMQWYRAKKNEEE